MRILVTGANGFVGRKLCTSLELAGHEVHRGVRVADGLPNTYVISETSSSGELRKAVNGIECVVHLAAQVHILGRLNQSTVRAFRETNVNLTRRLALAAQESGARRFVFVSSIKVCGEVSVSGPITETDALEPADEYALSKWEAEQTLRELAKSTGLEVVIVRPPLIYGEGVKANFLALLSAVRMGIPLPFSLLTNRRSMIYLGNFVSALSICVVHPQAAGETFHVADGESIALPRLVRELGAAMGRKTRIFPCPEWLLRVGGVLVGRYQQVDRLVNALEVDATKIGRTLGWAPPYTFSQGIAETAAWYMKAAKRGRYGQRIAGQEEVRVCQLCAVDFTLRHLLLPLVDGMQNQGWRVTSVCSDGKYVSELRKRGYAIETVVLSRNLFDVYSHLRALWGLYRLFRRERFDVLHVHTPIAALIGRIAGKLAGVPLIVYTAHGFYFHDEMPRWRYRFFVLLERLSGRLTDCLFTQSSEDAEVAVAVGISSAGNVCAIGNGVDVDLFNSIDIARRNGVRASIGIPEDAFVIGVVSRLVREKGLVEFLNAAVVLSGRFQNAHFLLIGERLSSDHDASIANELEAAQGELGPRLAALGYRSDIADLLGAMDVFCLPSYREGMPRSIIEAMMIALPVVATNIRGAREEVVPGVTGLLVPTKSSEALVAALGSLIADPDLARRMGQSGRQRAIALYDERQVVAKQLEIVSDRLLLRQEPQRQLSRTG